MDPRAYTCPECPDGGEDPGVLDVLYDYREAARQWAAHPPEAAARPDLFRYLPLLPVTAPPPAPVPAVGGTPLLEIPRLGGALGLGRLLVKDESRNPTRCLKDRATAIAVTLARELDVEDLYCASPGNAAISLSALCAHQGLRCHVFVPERASAGRLRWLEHFGAEVRRCPGSYDDAFATAEEVGRARGWYSRNCALNPFLVEGKKTVAFEIAEQLGGRAPDVVVSPVGDGCTLAAAGKGFRELQKIGRLDRLPRLLGVQPEAASPLVDRFLGRPPRPPGKTRAVSIAVRHPRNALRLLSELAASDGALVAVPDDSIVRAWERLGREAGIMLELSAAAALAGLEAFARHQTLAGAVVVLLLTGGRAERL